MSRPALIVHGGAGAPQLDLSAVQRAGCTAALRAGWGILDAGGTALDAVCAAVLVLENDPAFNAGIGSCLTRDGTVEMDASVMDGNGLRAGAVALVRRVRNPIRLARALLDDGRQILFAGAAADAIAEEHGVPTCAPDELITDRQRRRWQERHSARAATGTVGAAAVDRAGHVAAATSTGGLFDKPAGRIGDSAIIGAGTYADDRAGAASATGVGEAIIRVALSARVVEALRDGGDPTRAARAGIAVLERRVAGVGGIIVVDPLGRVGYASNAPHLTVGYMQEDLAAPVVHA